jgi:hypothetical protein
MVLANDLYALYGDDEVGREIVMVKLLSCGLSSMVTERVCVL